jgi:hypothetical protein
MQPASELDGFLVLKVTLLESQPSIWRAFAVPQWISLARLHDVIQIVMGWTDSHLYQFEIGSERYTEYLDEDEEALDSRKFRLGELLQQEVNRSFTYMTMVTTGSTS